MIIEASRDFHPGAGVESLARSRGAVLVSSALEQRKGEFCVPVHGPGSGATVRGTLGAVFYRRWSPVASPTGTPHGGQMYPGVTAPTALLPHQI